ncbi:MAG: hypothetical protein DRN17_03230 [Thermoplasmata archaeon]|nr:MAG: hypothetical protein DRN17_03230 [Thermoplasmata archaeon]
MPFLSEVIGVSAKLTKSDIKKTIAMAIAGAFGFIIALLWKDVVIRLMKLAGLWQDGGYENWNAAAIGIVVVLVITIICVFGIIFISKWGGVEE